MDIGAGLRQVIRSRWTTLVITVLVIGLWGWLLKQQTTALAQYPWDVAPAALVLSLLAGGLYFAGLGTSWALLLRTIASPAIEVSLGTATRVWLISMMTRYIPGNIWHIVGRIAFAERLHVSRTQVLTSATIEQLLVPLGALVVAVGMLPFGRVLPESQLWIGWLLPAGLLVLHPQFMGYMLRWAAQRLHRPELAWDYTFIEILQLLLVFAAANLMSGLALCALISGLAPIALSDWPFIIGAACLAWVLGYLSFFTPSGLGVREAALVALLVLIYPLPVAVVASLLFRIVLTLGEAIVAGIAWLSHMRTTT